MIIGESITRLEIRFPIRLQGKERFVYKDRDRRIMVHTFTVIFAASSLQEAAQNRPHLNIGEAYQVRQDNTMGRRVSSITYLPYDASPLIAEAIEIARKTLIEPTTI